ncbi:hypothetical protein AJ79_03418 [Helicocarpus griseus UAMH5409]|uniref:Uncharacterized protein n=1 Tax=Helicocarpus griseus UAMH5409 TaxID=1447875 RepID=A0A2B7XXU5_9EURO|nr:hypothetical protein AJ79_03418 [Helicocarpus griseus UAMH5409]
MSTTTYPTSNTTSNQQQQSHHPSPDPNDPTTVLLTYLSSPSTTTTNTLEDLHTTLLSSLQRAGWTERVRGIALELLRAGHCDRFEEVVDTVVALASGSEDVTPASLARGRKRKRMERSGGRGNKARVVEGPFENGNTNGNEDRNGVVEGPSEDGDGDVDEEYDANGMEGFPDIRIPQNVVAEGVKMLHEALDGVFVVEGGDSTSSTTATAGENDSKEQQERNKSKPASAMTTSTTATTNGIANGLASLPKKPPPPLKSTPSGDGKGTKSKAPAKGKPQDNGDKKGKKG